MSMLESTQSWPPAIAAKAKLKDVPENFMIYLFNWLGDIGDRKNCVLEITGAEFREAKSGPRKGQRCIKINGTERTTYLTPAELDALPKEEDDETLSHTAA